MALIWLYDLVKATGIYFDKILIRVVYRAIGKEH